MTHVIVCSATKEFALWRSESPVHTMVACTLARLSTTWERPRWTASWRSKVSVDQNLCPLYLWAWFPKFYFVLTRKIKCNTLRFLPPYTEKTSHKHIFVMIKEADFILGNQIQWVFTEADRRNDTRGGHVSILNGLHQVFINSLPNVWIKIF